MVISIIIVSYNTQKLLDECLTSIREHARGYSIETIVVDNHSTDGSLDLLREKFPEVIIIANHDNVGFAKANNQGFKVSHGDYLLLLNSDAMLTPKALSSLVELAEEKPEVGLIGACLHNPDGSFQASYTPFPTLWQEFLILTALGRILFGRYYPSRGVEDQQGPQQVGYVEGACMLVRRQAYEDTGGLDEYYFMYSEDVEICYRMKEKGWQVWYQPSSKIIHVGGASSKNRRPKREADLYCGRVQFFRRHYGNTVADILKYLIIIFTAIKLSFHGFLRFISRGRYGRSVVSLSYLIPALRKV